MSIDMYLGSSDQQASSAQHVLQNHINAYQQLQTALSQFTVNSPSLSGVTYQSAKAYSSQVLTPLLRASILLDEAIIAACRKLPSEYRSSVDGVDLRESDLVDRIARADRIVGRYQELINIEYQRKKPNWSRIQNLQTARSNQLTVKRKLEEKLHKLRAFHQSSPQIFSQIAGLHSAAQQGIHQSQQSWNASTKTFVLPPKSEMKWAEEVNGKWNQRSKVIEGYTKALQKVQNGKELTDVDVKAIAAYTQKYPEKKIPNELTNYFVKQTNGTINSSNIIQFLQSVASTSLEEITPYKVGKMDATLPSAGNYWSVGSSYNPYFGTSMQASFNSSAYGKDVVLAILKKFFKTATVSTVNLPIPGTNTTMGISGISSVFIGIDFLNNLREENPGRAITHTAVTTVGTVLGFQALTAGIGSAAVGGSGMALSASLAIMSNPVGWAIVGTVAVGLAVNYAYNNNFLGIKTIANSMGDQLNEDINNVGKFFNSSFKSIQKVFGW